MRKLLFVSSIIVLASQDIDAQAKSIFFEFGGNGLGISANFDSRFTKSDKGFGFRVGFGFLPGLNAKDLNSGQTVLSTPTLISIPVGINHLAGNAPNYFESGLGIDYVHISGNYGFFGDNVHVNGSGVLFIPSIGYRHARAGKAFQYRIVLSPLIGSGGAAFFGGFSLGFKF